MAAPVLETSRGSFSGYRRIGIMLELESVALTDEETNLKID
jgi:hypothetical protein